MDVYAHKIINCSFLCDFESSALDQLNALINFFLTFSSNQRIVGIQDVYNLVPPKHTGVLFALSETYVLQLVGQILISYSARLDLTIDVFGDFKHIPYAGLSVSDGVSIWY